MRVIVAGAITVEPFSAGIAWDWIQLALGLKRLGHDVLLVEQLRPDWGVDSAGCRTSYATCVNRERFVRLMRRFGLGPQSCQLCSGTDSTTGLSRGELTAWARSADLLLNISGHADDERILQGVRVRAYLDQDPVFTQLWAAEYGKDLGLHRHDVFFTVGLDVGTPRCPMPTAGVAWHPIVPPIVSELWTPVRAPDAAPFTTVASLTGYAELEFEGRPYGPKYSQFQRFARLPVKTRETMEVALKAFRADDPLIEEMRRGGWVIRDGGGRMGMDRYRRFIGESKAEIGIAQQAYVDGRSGWFSDRSAHYLAMGKPVLAQATGFEDHLPVGEGLIPFVDEDSALEGIAAICRDYDRHCAAARRLAERFFDFREVIPPLLEACRTASEHAGAARE